MVQVVEHSPVSSTDKLEKPKRAVQEAASPSSSLPRSTLPRLELSTNLKHSVLNDLYL